MANRYWHGVNTDTTDVNNWSTTRTGSTGSSVPGSSDTAYFLDGDGDVAANTAFAALNTIIGGNFKGNVLGLLLSTASATATIENVAFGKQISIGPAAGVTAASINVRSAGSGQVNIVAGAAGICTLLNTGGTGNVVVDGSCVVTTYNSANGNDIVTYSATAITTGQFGGAGTRKLQRSMTTATIDSSARVETNNSVAFTTATVSGGGVLAHDSDGTIGTLNAKKGGTLLPGYTPFAVTNCSVWEGSSISRNSDKISFSNAPVPVGNAA